MVTEIEKLTLVFRGLSDGSDTDPSEEPAEVGGGLDGGKEKDDFGDDGLPLDDSPIEDSEGEDEDLGDGTPEM